MKKFIKLFLIILFLFLVVLNSTVYGFNVEVKTDKSTVKVGEEFVYTIKMDEKVVATNFLINYDANSFELVGSKTAGLNVAKKDGKIACIYADIAGVGVDEIKIAFKAVKSVNNVTFKIEDAKFRAVNKETSYVQEDLQNSIKYNMQVEVKGNADSTASGDKLPNTGVGFGLAICIIVVLGLICGQKIKLHKMKDIIPAVIMLSLLICGSSVVKAKSVIAPSGIWVIDITGKDSDRKITKKEYMQINNEITNIMDIQGNAIGDNDIIKTGYTAIINTSAKKIALIGDANGDGYICDTDDIMVIVNFCLGKSTVEGEKFIAANVDNNDELLDADDIARMINVYLGKVDGLISVNPLENEEENNDSSEEENNPGEEENSDPSEGESNSNEEENNVEESKFKAGAYVKYNKPYTNVISYYWPERPEVKFGTKPTDTGWRVAFVEDGIVTLIAAGIPERVFLDENAKAYISNNSNFNKYVDSTYATEALSGLSKEEISKYNFDWLETFAEGNVVLFCLRDIETSGTLAGSMWYYPGQTTAGSGIEAGLRPIVKLKANIDIASGTGTKDDPYILKLN